MLHLLNVARKRKTDNDQSCVIKMVENQIKCHTCYLIALDQNNLPVAHQSENNFVAKLLDP